MYVPLSEQEKREFWSKHTGYFIPGYTGHCPTLKFHCGKCYGADTKEIMQEMREKKFYNQIPKDPYRDDEFKRTVLAPTEKTKGQTKDFALDYTNKSPKFIMGYTGFIPTMNFRYGKSFGRTADDCINEFSNHRRKLKQRSHEEERLFRAKSAPRMMSIRNHDEVSRTLREYERKVKFKDKELSPEYPPIAGYTGHIPKVKCNADTISKRYHTIVEESLAKLKEEREKLNEFKRNQRKLAGILKETEEKYSTKEI